MNKPAISVIMSNYNHEKYIAEALEAILSQSYKPIEVIIIDDASTDNSVEIIKEFVKRNPVISFRQNKKNKGALYNVNNALDGACGNYVYFAAADDKVLPGFFEKSMKLLSSCPDVGLCCADSAGIDNTTGDIIKRTINIVNNPSCFLPSMVAELMRNTPFYIEGRASIIKRQLMIESGGLMSDLKLYSDWFAWLVIAFRRGICYIPETLTTFRALPDSYFASEARNVSSRHKIIKRILFLLQSPRYRDIANLFNRSGVLNEVFLKGILHIMLCDYRNWKFLSAVVIQKSLSYNLLKAMSSITPFFIKDIYRNMRNRKIKGQANKIIEKAYI